MPPNLPSQSLTQLSLPASRQQQEVEKNKRNDHKPEKKPLKHKKNDWKKNRKKITEQKTNESEQQKAKFWLRKKIELWEERKRKSEAGRWWGKKSTEQKTKKRDRTQNRRIRAALIKVVVEENQSCGSLSSCPLSLSPIFVALSLPFLYLNPSPYLFRRLRGAGWLPCLSAF